jgi:hydroxymethylpyrimidine/phosphomethylpyrimidine kinase
MHPARINRPSALTIAGSDPSGGAGLQADLKTFAALGVYGFSAMTEVIAQNSSRVFRVAPVNPGLVAAQIEAIAIERKPNAVKIGALGTAAIVKAVAKSIIEHRLAAPVLDPVLISSSGTRLLTRAGQGALIAEIFPIARVVTPNIPEAAMLTRIQIRAAVDVREAARRIVKMGVRAVVIKGGHLSADSPAIDLLYDGRSFTALNAARIDSDAHGTGCAFSAAIAAHLARGRDLESAVRGAKQFVNLALKRSFKFGRGRALLDHFAASKPRARSDI